MTYTIFTHRGLSSYHNPSLASARDRGLRNDPGYATLGRGRDLEHAEPKGLQTRKFLKKIYTRVSYTTADFSNIPKPAARLLDLIQQ